MTLKKRSNDSDDARRTRRVKVSSLLFNLRRDYSKSLIHFFFPIHWNSSGGGFLRAILDCLQSIFSLKIRLVLISSSVIANHDVICSRA